MVEESEITLASPSRNQEAVEDVNSLSLSASLGYSNILSFPDDDAVDKFFQGAGIGIFIEFYFQLLLSNLLSSCIRTNQI